MAHTVTTVVERLISGSWNNITSFVRGDIGGERLIPSNDEDDKLASVGECRFKIDNASGNFSTNGNFKRGIPIRVTTTYDGVSKVRFLGNIYSIDPDTLEWGDQYSRVTCVDWMQYLIDLPMIATEIQVDATVEEAVAHLLTLVEKQPEGVEYHTGANVFDAAFSDVKDKTRAYTELNKLAMSEFAPIYLKAGNILVVESFDTRNGTRELTEIPKSKSDSGFLLKEDGGYLLKEDGGRIILDQLATPLLSGTFMEIKVDNGSENLANHVTFTLHPTTVDDTPQILFRLNSPVLIKRNSSIILEGTWANPDGGEIINAQNIQAMVTGTSYQGFQFQDGTGLEYTTRLALKEDNGAESFRHIIFNNGVVGVYLTKYEISGYGLYRYNPVSTTAGVTGSISSHGVVPLSISQAYQGDLNWAERLAERTADDEKDPRHRPMSVTFDASYSADLMQASQIMDIGDLTYVSNARPFIDTYAYIHGKKWTITPAGIVTEKWYLKDVDSLRKGLKMVALKTNGKSAAKNVVDFGIYPQVLDLPQKTISYWIKQAALSQFPPVGKYADDGGGADGWYVFHFGANGNIQFRQNFDPTDGIWNSSQFLTGSVGVYHNILVTYDRGDVANLPSIYFDGVAQLVSGSQPVGTFQSDETVPLTLLNVSTQLGENLYNSNVELKDVRIYDRILTVDEIQAVATRQDDYHSVTDGLVFQAPCVKDEDYPIITGSILYPYNKIIDNVYGYRGTPSWYLPSGTAFALRAYGTT